MERNLNQIRFISSQKGLSKNSELHMKEFTINKFLKLKLEDDKTIIYVNNERFDQCKHLLLEIPIDEITSLEDIESIDDVAQRLHPLYQDENAKQFKIPPEVEFWGHCSNLQVWYENNYNTKLLHRNLGFPLLWKLTQVGDKLAKKMFNEEIVIRFTEGNKTVRKFLRESSYLRNLEKDQFSNLLFCVKFESFEELLITINTYFIIDRNLITEFFQFIDSFDSDNLRELIIDPQEATYLNFYLTLAKYLGKYRKEHSKNQLFKDGFKKIGRKVFDDLVNLLVDSDNYINISVFENLAYIDNKQMKEFLIHTKYKFKFGSEFDSWDFQYFLNVLLLCFRPNELMLYLENFYRKDFIQKILPQIHGFNYLKMSDQEEINMKQFITAFLLEEAGAVDYRENMRKLGDFLVNTFLSELIDRNNEVNEQIIETLLWIGGVPARKVYKKICRRSDYYKYKHMFWKQIMTKKI